MKTISIEYCHIYPGNNEKEEIKKSNEWTHRALKMFPDYKIQKCMMIDDIHATREIDNNYLQSIIERLEIKPDCIYKESEFIQEAHEMVKAIDPHERDFIKSAERTWLRENVSKYRTTTEFLLSWQDNKGQTKFSCPSLATTSYLTRLGYIKADGVQTIFGEELITADYVFNILSSVHLEIEDKAQSIIEATFKEALRKIGWFFY